MGQRDFEMEGERKRRKESEGQEPKKKSYQFCVYHSRDVTTTQM